MVSDRMKIVRRAGLSLTWKRFSLRGLPDIYRGCYKGTAYNCWHTWRSRGYWLIFPLSVACSYIEIIVVNSGYIFISVCQILYTYRVSRIIDLLVSSIYCISAGLSRKAKRHGKKLYRWLSSCNMTCRKGKLETGPPDGSPASKQLLGK